MLDVLLGMIFAFFIGLGGSEDSQGACMESSSDSAQQVPCPLPPPSSTDSTDDGTGLIKVGGSGLIKVGGSG